MITFITCIITGLRFGNGLYFSSSSGKSNDYAGGSQETNNGGQVLRMLMLCKVVLGRVYILSDAKGDKGWSQASLPPPGSATTGPLG